MPLYPFVLAVTSAGPCEPERVITRMPPTIIEYTTMSLKTLLPLLLFICSLSYLIPDDAGGKGVSVLMLESG